MKITALTCSTGRPECLALCRQYVARQTMKVDEHIVQEGGTFLENMRAGLRRVSRDPGIVVFFEDDDWYDPMWVSDCASFMKDQLDLFGQATIWNYHVPSGGYESATLKRGNCPMHATAIRVTPDLLSRFDVLLRDIKDHRVDVALWSKEFHGLKLGMPMNAVVSMKGMPGTPGHSLAHQASRYTKFDTDRSVLRSWIGDDIANYQPYFQA